MAEPQPQLPQENSKKKLAIAIAVGVIFFAAIGSVIFFATKKSPQQIKAVAVNSVSIPAATPVASAAPAAVAQTPQQAPPENNFQPPQQQPDNFQPPDEQPPDQQNPPGGNNVRPRFPMPMGPPPRMAPVPAQGSVVADTIKQYEVSDERAELAGQRIGRALTTFGQIFRRISGRGKLTSKSWRCLWQIFRRIFIRVRRRVSGQPVATPNQP